MAITIYIMKRVIRWHLLVKKQITDRDVILPAKDVEPNPIQLDENGNVKSYNTSASKGK